MPVEARVRVSHSTGSLLLCLVSNRTLHYCYGPVHMLHNALQQLIAGCAGPIWVVF